MTDSTTRTIERGYIDTKDVAVMIRKALAGAFPGVKFSVRISRYSGGSSTDVRWTDGPTEPDVRKVTDVYGGRGFDGMTDSSTYNDCALGPDGFSARYLTAEPLPEGWRRVHFSPWSPSLRREYSEAFQAAARATVTTVIGNPSDWNKRVPFQAHRDNGRVIIASDSMVGDYPSEILRTVLHYTPGR
jgi:hypothetical protein